ncbi:hypothetical protein GSI_11169 [Ganoderma sinense ZZ0214-1]|uniref:Uncharacterized protein n=1 Tax=Ganoderma sinense ZZ0214-1 TaxID=1077348 RepID=A0A2G8RZ28_9APHY|nr:hypothetical protein GSI_11169 [Ganoderma sinense ZZ0214-1]
MATPDLVRTTVTSSPNPISSILLAMKRMRRPTRSPEKILPYLKSPKFPSDDCHYLDALAALCTFASGPGAQLECDSAAAVVEYHERSNCLYLATRPSAPLDSTLRSLVPIWIALMQDLSRQVPEAKNDSEAAADLDLDSEADVSTSSGPSSEELDGPKPWTREYTALERAFIVEVYRACHAKLLNVVNLPGDPAQLLKQKVSEEDSATLRLLNITGSPLVEKLELLTSVAKKEREGLRAESLSAEDLLDLHCAAGTVAWFKDEIPIRDLDPRESTLVLMNNGIYMLIMRSCITRWRIFIFTVYEAVYGLSHAVDTIIQFASSAQHKTKIDLPWTVVWVDVPDSRAPAFLVTTNAQELAAMVTHDEPLRAELISVFNKWKPFDPPQSGLRLHMVDGSPSDHTHFTGTGAVHPEAALLHYIHYDANRDVARSLEPYLGCSRPICYPCLMLLDACSWELDIRLELGLDMDMDTVDDTIPVGRRCVDFARLDVAWAFPQEVGREIYETLVRKVVQDFRDLCTEPDYTAWRPPLGYVMSGET